MSTEKSRIAFSLSFDALCTPYIVRINIRKMKANCCWCLALIEMLIFICQLTFVTRQHPESYLGMSLDLYASGINTLISHSQPPTHQSIPTFKCIPQHRSIVRHVLEKWLFKKTKACEYHWVQCVQLDQLYTVACV